MKAVEQAVRLPAHHIDPAQLLKKPTLGGDGLFTPTFEVGENLNRKLVTGRQADVQAGKHTFTDLKGRNRQILKDNQTRKR